MDNVPQCNHILILFVQVKDYISSCLQCNSRTAQHILSTEQRQAMSGHHPLTLIKGQLGTGKVCIIAA